MSTVDVLVVGGGVAGLACARAVAAAGRSVLVLEGGDEVGGRVRTDAVDGFRIDRGFQVLLTAYPEVRRLLDLAALEPRPFEPGALVWTGGRFAQLTDPWRRPWKALASLGAPLGTLGDKRRVAALRRDVAHDTLEALWARPETTTAERLAAWGFTPAFVDAFFRPWFGGVFFDRSLATSSRMFDFVFRMFSAGEVVLPARGMGEIPRQLAAGLPRGGVRTGVRVASVRAGEAVTEAGERIAAGAVVVATASDEARRLLPALEVPRWRAVTTLWWAADRPPVDEPVLVLDGTGEGPVNDLHVASLVAPERAPAGSALVGATVLEDRGLDDEALDGAARAQLGRWFDGAPTTWRRLRVDRIPHALPDQAAPALAVPRRPSRVEPGLHVAGDHRADASLNGAMASGRLAADGALEDLAR